ncbi:protein PERCC1 [Heteronotia binoei]|uniref:protein PERCC1 n=1 Tax=Heteronotia binoei TaxID=13085 RepID=UPI00292FD337|nr:protein PERCC1 [Heteronotia binoei]
MHLHPLFNGQGRSRELKMAAGVIQNLSKFRLPMAFQHSFQPTSTCQEMVFQDSSEEEEMEEEEEEERDDTDPEDSPQTLSPGRGEQAASDEPSLSNAEMTLQLLQFAERISDDIQRYFGRKNKDEEGDPQNIYDDRGSLQLSGRVLYYADLVRMSQSGEPEEGDDFLATPKTLDPQLWKCLCGKDGAGKLGPLAELFEYGLCQYMEHRASSKGQNSRVGRKYAHVTPMQSRKLPQSFWKEPSQSPIGLLNSNPPDFSDLLANWTCEASQEGLLAGRELVSEIHQRAADADHFGGL